MLNSSERAAFKNACMADGIVIERVISRVYHSTLEGAGNAQVIDGGANIGHHTFQLAAMPQVERVWAVEANPATAEDLRRRLSGFWGAEKVVVVEAALQGDPEVRSVSFQVSETHPGRSGINPVMQRYGTTFERTVNVRATTIDALGATDVRFIKLDLGAL